jgi:hypothetical protein
MTKKHFEMLALSIKMIENEQSRRDAAEAISGVCKVINSRFDTNRFLTACGV